MNVKKEIEKFDLSAYLKAEKEMIEQELNNILPKENTRPEILHQAMRYAVFTGGKRIRPILCKAACKVICGTSDPAVLPAMALELLHTYTLVHDDLPSMDDDTERRGKPTVHIQFGEANAILTGDALQAFAFEIITRNTTTNSQTVQLIKELAIAAGSCGVIGGQVEDLAASGLNDPARIEWIHLHKTARLFMAALRMGGIAASADDEQLADLEEYGRNLGLAFQITDDILDAQTETTSPQDIETTYLSVYSISEAKNIAKQYVETAIKSLKNLPNSENILPLYAIAEFIVERTI